MSYLWPLKDRRESRIIYICQVLGILLGIFLFASFDNWKIGLSQCLWGVVGGWLIGAVIYMKLAAKETDAKFDPAAVADKEDGVRKDRDERANSFFLIARDADIDRHVILDEPRSNHFTYYNRCDIDFAESEYEYRVEGTKVLVRLLGDYAVNPGKGNEWDVRDGVVMESDMRSRQEDEAANSSLPGDLRDAFRTLEGSIDEQIAVLRKQTEWCELLPMGVDADLEDSLCAPGSHLVGLKYFILLKHMPPADARRFLRQELERLKTGVRGFTDEAAKLGLGPGGRRGLTPLEGRSWPSGDKFRSLVESASTFGISYREFTLRESVAGVLQTLLATVRA